MKNILLVFLLVGCSQLPPILSTADAVGRGLSHVLGWCRDASADEKLLVPAIDSAKKGDYSHALDLANQMVAQLKAKGVKVPDETGTILELAQEAMAARAIEQGMRALSGKPL